MKTVGQVYAIGNSYIIKIAEANGNGFNAHTWVKTKKNWTKKTSFYGTTFPEGNANHAHWRLLSEQEVENLAK